MVATATRHVRIALRSIGVHLRLTTTLSDLIEKALRLKLDTFQFFLVHQDTLRLFMAQDEDRQKFIDLRRQHFNKVYVHGSYWINLSGVKVPHHKSLQRELSLTSKLECTDIVLHAGSAKGGKNKKEGIDAVANIINSIVKKTDNAGIMLENSAHGKLTVGSDFEDFKLILEKLDNPDAVSFCIDTAHAHSYGYDITTPPALEDFLDLLESTIGIKRIALIHLNDTSQKRGSKIDRHEIIGGGLLGDAVLKNFVLHPRIAHVPIIMELPELQEDEELKIIEKVRSWHH